MSRLTRAPRTRGASSVVAVLPNGRSVWLNVDPAPVSLREIDSFTGEINRSDGHQVTANRSNTSAIRKLKQEFSRDVDRIVAANNRDNGLLRNRVRKGDAGVSRKFANETRQQRRQSSAALKRLSAQTRSTNLRTALDHLLLVSSLPLVAAYGEGSKPLSSNNLVIAVSLGVWLLGDDVAELVSGRRNEYKDSPHGVTFWSYLAPFANLLNGWWFLKGQQHKRFVSGLIDESSFVLFDPDQQQLNPGNTTAPGSNWIEDYYATVDLSSLIARDHLKSFKSMKNVPALATVRSAEFEARTDFKEPGIDVLKAQVNQGVLWIVIRVSAEFIPSRESDSIPARGLLLSKFQVAWVTDSRESAPV